MRFTVNLSRAKTYSRQKRAQKAMHILREKVEDRVDGPVSISPEVNTKIWERGAEKPPTSLEIEIVDSPGGKTVVLPEQERDVEQVREEEPEEEEEETGEAEDYSEIVSGTVSEAKEAVEELDSPDYEALVEAEEQGKDRKTLKEWLEQRM